MIELADHPFFVASQYHPEFKSRPDRPAPLFREFVGAAQRYAVRARAGGGARRRRADPAPAASSSDRAPPREAGERGREGEAERDVRRAVPDPEPVRARGRDRRARDPRARGHGAVRAGRRARQPAGPRSAAAASARSCSARTSTPSRSAARSSRRSSTAAGRTSATRSSAPTTRPPSPSSSSSPGASTVEGSPVPLELLLTVEEEDALRGAKAFDAGVLDADFGYVLDHATPIGEVIVASPTYYRLERRVPRPRRARRHPPRGGPERDPRRRDRDRRDAARADRRPDDRERRLDPGRRRVHERRPRALPDPRRGALARQRPRRVGDRRR